jgi:hypothetical protein
MDDTVRPMHVIMTGNEVTYTPLTDAEIAAKEEREQAHTEQKKARLDARAADLATIRAKMGESEAYAALVRILGINVNE